MKANIIRIKFIVVTYKRLILGAELIKSKNDWSQSVTIQLNSVADKLKINSRLPPLKKINLRPYNK
jgi:hypothetical protein